MHDSKLIFVRAATFGQLTKQIFDHESSSLNSKSLCEHGMAFDISNRQAAIESNVPIAPSPQAIRVAT